MICTYLYLHEDSKSSFFVRLSLSFMTRVSFSAYPQSQTSYSPIGKRKEEGITGPLEVVLCQY